MTTNGDPFRLRVLKAICEVIETIKPVNGFEFDLSPELINDANENGVIRKVFRGRDVFGESDPVPMVYLLETPTEQDQIPGQSDNPTITGPWEILIGGYVDSDINNPTDPAHRLMGEVKSVLGKQKERKKPMTQIADYFGFGDRKTNVIKGFQISPGIVRPPDEVSAKAYFYLTVTLTITEDTSRPYA